MKKTKPKKESSETKTNQQKTTLIVILGILALPVAFPLAIAAISIVFALLVTLISLIFAFGVSGGAMILAGIVYLPIAIIALAQDAAVGLGALGTGLLVLGLGILFLKGAFVLGRISFRAAAYPINKISSRKESK